eukprot:6568033-Prymnesium_polylepis.1
MREHDTADDTPEHLECGTWSTWCGKGHMRAHTHTHRRKPSQRHKPMRLMIASHAATKLCP